MEYKDLSLKDTLILLFVVISHATIIVIFALKYDQRGRDEKWTPYTMSYKEAKEEGLATSTYVAYLFWNVTDTPGDNSLVTISKEDYLDTWGVIGGFVTFILFILYESMAFNYFRNAGNAPNKKYLIGLILLTTWLVFESIRLPEIL